MCNVLSSQGESDTLNKHAVFDQGIGVSGHELAGWRCWGDMKNTSSFLPSFPWLFELFSPFVFDQLLMVSVTFFIPMKGHHGLLGECPNMLGYGEKGSIISGVAPQYTCSKAREVWHVSTNFITILLCQYFSSVYDTTIGRRKHICGNVCSLHQDVCDWIKTFHSKTYCTSCHICQFQCKSFINLFSLSNAKVYQGSVLEELGAQRITARNSIALIYNTMIRGWKWFVTKVFHCSEHIPLILIHK